MTGPTPPSIGTPPGAYTPLAIATPSVAFTPAQRVIDAEWCEAIVALLTTEEIAALTGYVLARREGKTGEEALLVGKTLQGSGHPRARFRRDDTAPAPVL